MRILIDLQGRQSSGSKHRGIGRYSLSISQAIVRNKKDHDIFIVLSSLFPNEVEVIKNELKNILPLENIFIWEGKNDSSYLASNPEKRKTAELSRELFLQSLDPDIIYITSLFEGLGDEAVSSVDTIISNIPVAVTLYDLIPLINEKPYLDNPTVKKWYLDKIEHLKRADLLLSISESSRQEALKYLNSNSDEVVNISTASDAQFKKIKLTESQKLQVLERYSIKNEFLMYTGGIDLRKNIEGLIRSYAKLPAQVRVQYQLAIVCSINDEQKKNLRLLVNEVGLVESEVVFTGFISEGDLIALYNLCKAFVFPSWHEGFGLPVLEAMWCGAPVIAANCSSLPEVIGLEEALFDPYNDQNMANKIEEVLTDDLFRQRLIKHAEKQILKFSWDLSAKKAIEAFEVTHQKSKNSISTKPERLKLAYVSPLPPERSGIADYSAELLTELYNYYDIDVIVEQKTVSISWVNEHCRVIDVASFKESESQYDRVLYHFGNSHFHSHMFQLLIEIPGVVVLHDFYLSGAINYMSVMKYESASFEDELFYSHGNAPFNCEQNNLVMEYPCNKKILDYSKGIIVHSLNSCNLAKEWYGKTYANDWSIIPLLKIPPIVNDRDKSREKLELPNNATVIASFGGMNATKLNWQLLTAWLESSLSQDENCYLIFVGEVDDSDYGNEIQKLIDSSSYNGKIIITGWVEHANYKNYLAASDIGVQLRTFSRGETSAAVLDCMNYGLATIVNCNGSMVDLSREAVLMLPDEFIQTELINALETLYKDEIKRKQLSQKASSIIIGKHSPKNCANQYVKTIEACYAKNIINKEGSLEFKATKAEIEAAKEKIVELEAKVNSILDSSSWRVTAFYRFLGRGLKAMLSNSSKKEKLLLIQKSVIFRMRKNNFLRTNIKKIVYKYPKLHHFYFKNLNVIGSENINVGFNGTDISLNIREQQVYNDIRQLLTKERK
tara:strand:+ start:32759 stop:35617 length:2859 start_codon:yes stop_codon:yes gene_type:complete